MLRHRTHFSWTRQGIFTFALNIIFIIAKRTVKASSLGLQVSVASHHQYKHGFGLSLIGPNVDAGNFGLEQNEK